MLRPVKVEMVWRKPRILIFRDLLSPVEAKQIKDIATPKVSYHLVEFNPYPVKFCLVEYLVFHISLQSDMQFPVKYLKLAGVLKM